ncbi:MAG: flagellar hook-length control protein FliK [Bacillus sp. (in: Bacteria)]|nr:flagellar hook-length control protein FliK [Bacillus sp. (in: firmicutes)]
MDFIDLLQLSLQTTVDQTIRKTTSSSILNGHDSSSFASLFHGLSTIEITPDEANLGDLIILDHIYGNMLSNQEDQLEYSYTLKELVKDLVYILTELNQPKENKSVPAGDELESLYIANQTESQMQQKEVNIPSQPVEYSSISFEEKQSFLSEGEKRFQIYLPEKKLEDVITELLHQLRFRKSEVAQERGQETQKRTHILSVEGLLDTLNNLSKEFTVDLQEKEMVYNKLENLIKSLTEVKEKKAELQDILLMDKKQFTVKVPKIFENQYSLNNIFLKSESGSLVDGSNFFVNSIRVPSSSGFTEATPVASFDQGLQLKEVPVRSSIEETIQPKIIRMSHMIEDLANIFRGVLRISKSMEGTQLRLNIFPEHLGHLDIRIMESNGKIAAQIIASSLMAKEALELQINQLRTTLLQQGLLIEKLEITQEGLHQTFEQHGEQAFSQQQQKGQSAPKKNGYSLQEEEKLQPRMKDNQAARVDYTI